MKNIIIEFERVTKYPLLNFLYSYRNFMLDSYSEIDRYFSGIVPTIDNKYLIDLKNMTNECQKVLSYFKNFSNKFNTCGYWELMEMIDQLNTTIEKINKLPKFRRTALTKRGYQPYVQVGTSVGGFRTFEDIANAVSEKNGDNSDWVDLMINNDMEETDWQIDELTNIDVFISNKTDIVVTTILDQPIGDRIYGKDISRVINFIGNDLEIKSGKDNVEQKCDILLNLNRGEVPENMLFGKNQSLFSGVSVKQFMYPALVQDLQNNFLQNDLFESLEVTGFNFVDGDIKVVCNIKTKYDYSTEKTLSI